MAFWGVVLKPAKPYIHTYSPSKGRLRVTQATLGSGNDLLRSKVTVQCSVGHRAPVFLCTLFPEKTESLQLDIEFKEAQDVILSVMGQRSVHLIGYYVGGGVHLNSNDESEPDGEDIAYTETERSSDNDSLEKSFIDDSDLSISDDEVVEKCNKKTMMCKRRRLRKKFQPSESGDEKDEDKVTIIVKSDDEDDHEDKDFFTLTSSLLKRKTNLKSTSQTVIKSEDRKAGNDLSLDEAVADNGADLRKESEKSSKEQSTREAEKMSCGNETEQLVAENQPKRKKKKIKKNIKIEENIDEQTPSTDQKIGKVEIKKEPIDYTEDH